MSEIIYKTFILEDIIDFDKCKTNSSSFTKTFINSNKGEIPVYGASKEIDEVGYGYVKDNLKGVKYFENCLTWNIDGSIAVFYRKNRFSLSEKVIPLILKDSLKSSINLDYLRIMIQQSAEIKSFHFSNKAGKSKLKKIKIQIPVNQNNKIDIETQISFVEKYIKIEEKINLLNQKKAFLEDVIIDDNLLENSKYKEVLISEIFSPENGCGTYTKTFCKNNTGNYPVYSGSSIDIFSNINTYDYDGEYLTWVKDGLAGYLMYHNEKFSITNHRGILLPKVDMLNLDLKYLKYIIEPIFRNECKGRVGHDGQNEYTTLNQTMINNIKTKIKIPIDKNGCYDLNKQKEIANKYRKIEEIKRNISTQIDMLCSTEIKL